MTNDHLTGCPTFRTLDPSDCTCPATPSARAAALGLEVPALRWTHDGPGRWSTAAPINGEADQFLALAYRTAEGVRGADMWRVSITTHNRPLDTEVHRHLVDARAYAQAAYDAVEGVNL